LVSGSRLRALHFTGSDGSKAPVENFFWDNQLNIYCSALLKQDGSSGVCHPMHSAVPVSMSSGYFTDANCQTPAQALSSVSGSMRPFGAGLPPSTPVFVDGDGSLYTAILVGPAYIKEGSNPCRLYDGSGGYFAYTRGSPLSVSLVEMPVTRD
jgi:hypothetical protein